MRAPLALLLWASPLAASAAPPAATVSHLSGKASAGSDAEHLAPIAQGAGIDEGATLRTDKGARVELSFPDGSRFRVAGGAEVVVEKAKVVGKKREQISLKLLAGRAWASVAKSTGGADAFEVRTENATAGVRGTSFAVLAAGDASALVRVYSGTVGVKPSATKKGGPRTQVPGPKQIDQRQWEEIIATAMKEVRVSAAGEVSPAQDFEDEGESLEWAQWNQARDAGAGK